MPKILQERFLALVIVLATAMLLCSCVKQPPMAPMATVFHVVEAPDGRLNADTIASAANVQVQYDSMAINDTLAVTWHGSPEHGASIQTVHQIAPLNFLIPKAWITENLNRSVNLTYTYKVGGQGNVIRSSPITVAVTGQQQAQVFRVVEAPNGTLNVDTLTGPATVEITNSAIHAGDTVGIKAVGVTTYNSPYPTVGGSGPLHYPLANDFVRANIGRSITLTYTYKVGGVGNLITSAPIVVAVTSSPVTNVFRVLEAPNGSLNADTLTGPATVEITDSAIHAGDTVGIKAVGVTTYDSPYPPANGSGPLHYSLTNAFVRANIGRSITLTYSYKVGGTGDLHISAPITVSVTSANVGNGPQVAANLNTRYRNTAATCAGNTPAYHCNGVVIRSTIPGAYDPWDPSPAAIRLGAVSFSYMRLDAHVDHLYHGSGFTFYAQDQVPASKLRPNYLCSYAWDPGTADNGHSANGCGLKTRADQSSCRAVGVVTPQQWQAYPPHREKIRDYQCSLSTADPQEFQTSISVRAQRPPLFENIWNEIVIALWGQGQGATLPLEAFFYTDANLNEARTYQTKFKARTAQWLPIIKLDLTQLNANPFSYSAADQAVQP